MKKNDKFGVYTNTTYVPTGVTSLFNSTTNQFDFSQLNVGDELKVKVISLIRDDRKIYLNFADVKEQKSEKPKE